MIYTVRFAHLERKPALLIGDKIERGDLIGKMGCSGQSTAAHLHIDCIKGRTTAPYKLSDIGENAAKDQLDYFIDEELFGVEPVITTGFLDPEYKEQFRKDHPAYDVVPVDRHKTQRHYWIKWNRSKVGTVSMIVNQSESYGHCVYVEFEA